MRAIKAIAFCIMAGVAAPIAFAADASGAAGVLLNKHQQTVADTSMDPGATTLGQFFHDYPRGAPGRVPMVPTKEVASLRVRKASGEQVDIVQDLEDSKNLSVGDKVLIEQVDGKDRVVSAQ